MSTVKQFVFILILIISGFNSHAQKVDSIFFHLYTDSLKKGVYNYINVDGKLSTGAWRPLTAKEINFSSTDGRFEGNSLIIDTGFTKEKVTVKAVLKENTAIWKEVTIYIKKIGDIEKLKTVDDVMDSPSRQKKRRGRT